MPDLPLFPRSDHKCVQIRHRQNPLSYIIEGERTDDTHRSQIYCKILSNSYFYTTFLSQLESYPSFESLFYQCLIELLLNKASAHLCFQPVFSYASYRNNSIRLRVDPRLNRFDEWINRRWYDACSFIVVTCIVSRFFSGLPFNYVFLSDEFVTKHHGHGYQH